MKRASFRGGGGCWIVDVKVGANGGKADDGGELEGEEKKGQRFAVMAPAVPIEAAYRGVEFPACRTDEDEYGNSLRG